MDQVGICRDLSAIGVDAEAARITFHATKDIRDKYVLSRLAWDLGILEELM
jgi:glycerol-1-phosphate dehydrogenase [NAD(P)+]